jgi:hippurate hydrolase
MEPALASKLAGWRRHLHAHPELSRHEAETAAFVRARLDELAIPYEHGIGGHGIVATLARGQSNRSVGLRADMDALPIEELTGLPYASGKPGVMHACGHDGHTVSLLGAATLLHRDPDWTGTVQLIFQPAEEGAGGALAMLADGVLDRFPFERVFAYHNWPGLPLGTVAVHTGPVMAAASWLEITMDGQAGHAGMPHLTRDPVLAAAHALVALQSVIARNINPVDSAVLSICTLEAGNATNQIPQRTTMRGTFRTHRQSVREAMSEDIPRVVHGIAAAMGVNASVTIRHGTPATVNPADEAAFAAEVAATLNLPVLQNLAPSMAAEDFGVYLLSRPGAFVWIGNGDSSGLHSPNYDFNDALIPTAATYLAALAKEALA